MYPGESVIDGGCGRVLELFPGSGKKSVFDRV